MKKLYLLLMVALSAVPVWAEDLTPEPLGREIKEYNTLSTGDVDPGNHEIWKLYIVGSLIPKGNYNHETEIFIASLFPSGPYIVYLRINQLYNFLQPIPKVGDVIAVEGHVVSHFNSTIDGPTKTNRIPVLYFYVENASKLPFEPEAAAQILGTQTTPTAVPAGSPAADNQVPPPPASAASGQTQAAGTDGLRVAPEAQAIQEYHSFWSAKDIDPSNHEIWKVYIRRNLTAKDDPGHKPKDFSTVLTLTPKPSWVVRLDIQELSRFIQPAPKLGDVIIVDGRITGRLIHMSKAKQVKTLTMEIHGAQKVQDEAAPIPAETAEEENDFVSASALPPSAAPVAATPGFFKADAAAR